jgi:hypothetical protein
LSYDTQSDIIDLLLPSGGVTHERGRSSQHHPAVRYVQENHESALRNRQDDLDTQARRWLRLAGLF